MTTAYTSLLGLALPVTGELQGTWGDTVNNSITSLLDTAVAGTTTISTDGDVTLSTTTGAANQARQAIILCSGARTALRTLVAPAQSKVYTIINATTGGYAVKLVGAGPTTGLTIPNGASAVVAWNGSDFVEVGSGTIGNLTVNGNLSVTGNTTLGDAAGDTTTVSGPMTLSAGTANGVLYLNGSKVATSGSALTWDATTLTFGSTGQRITGDLANATSSNRLLFQNSTVNGNSNVGAIPNGTSTTASFIAYNASDANNASTAQLSALSTTVRVNAGQTGTGTYLPITFFTNGSEQMRLDTSGNLGLGVTPSAWDSAWKGLQVGPSGSISNTGTGTPVSVFSNNAYYNGANWVYINTAAASQYQLSTSQHIWRYAASGSGNIAWSEAMRLDSSGNLGLGVTPNAWSTTTSVLENPSGSIYTFSGTNQIGLNSNAYFNGTNWIYRNASSVGASDFYQQNGFFIWRNAAAGTAGNTVTFSELMRLNSTGLGIGTSSPGVKLDIGSGTLRIKNATGDASGLLILQDTSDTAKIINYYNGPLVFGTNNTERARITNTGDLLVAGTNTGAAGIAIAVARNYSFGEGSGESYVNLFRQNSSAATVLANGYKYSGTANGFASSISSSWAKCAIGLGVAGGAITFYTNTAATVANGTDVTPTERMRLDSSGNLGIGTSSPGAKLEVYGGAAGTVTNAQVGNASTAFLVGVDGSNNCQLRTAQSVNMLFYTAATERARIDSSGNLSIGTTTMNPAGFSTGMNINGASNTGYQVSVGGTFTGFFGGYSGETRIGSVGATVMTFYTNSNERARITSGGDLLVGRSTGIGGERLFVEKDLNAAYLARFNNANSASPFGLFVNYSAAAPNGTSNQFLRCDDSAATRAEIRSNGGIANYSANDVNLSDRREKTNFAPAKSYLDVICSIPVQTFNYIDQNLEDDPGTTLGVVAQDVQAVAPEFVHESNWGTEDNPKMRLSVYQTDLQYALMKCIQEQQALITDLRARVAQLEAKG